MKPGLVRWNGGLSSSLQRLEAALERERCLPAPSAPRGPALVKTGAVELPPRVDLLRVCAPHEGSPWAAVYLLNANRGYDYASSIALSNTLCRTQYAPGVAQAVIWDNTWIDEEVCALCGVAGRPVRCGGCGKLSCRGLSTGRYFRCGSCRAEGWMEKSALEHLGVIPKLGG
jgi:hypothetical protein